MKKLIGWALLTAALSFAPVTLADAQYLSQHQNYSHFTAITATLLKPAPGILHSVCFNTPVATNVVTLYDNTAQSGPQIAIITLGATAPAPFCFTYNASFNVGLFFQSSTAGSDITVTWE